MFNTIDTREKRRSFIPYLNAGFALQPKARLTGRSRHVYLCFISVGKWFLSVTQACVCSEEQKFYGIYKPPHNSRRQKSDMKQIP
jgi:hypothetical protein